MRLNQRLGETARDFDAALADTLDELTGTATEVPSRLADAMRHAVMAGGKRMRPFLVLETAAMFGASRSTAMPAAIALELVHCYSLAHDDLPAMDNDALRRGQPTVWKAFDDWTAILAGDALLTWAFEVLATADLQLAPEVRVTLMRELARAAGPAGMVGGQCLDLEADKLKRPPQPSIDHVQRLQALKTGALFRFACQAGALIGRASPPEEAALARFGATLGAAFQLADDLLDVEGEAAVVGKATGKDAGVGKATLVGLAGIPGAKRRLHQIERSALAELESFGPRADVLREALAFAVRRQN